MTVTPRLRRPEELDHLDLERSAVIEASAGTGKTYLLEHLVLELLITGRARLDEILVVTFTERATAELVVRIRQKIDHALTASDAVGWTLDGAAKQRLREARQSFDQATIATIHSFCQRILTDEPLTTRRLLEQTQVDGREAFGEVFRDVLRRELATSPAHATYLTGYLATGRGVGDLEELLYRAGAARGDWANVYDEDELRHLAERLARLDVDAVDLVTSLRAHDMHHSRITAMLKRLRRLVGDAEAAVASGGWGRFLACFDDKANVDIFGQFEDIAAWGENVPPGLASLRQIAVLALRAAPPLDHAIAQRFLPLVEAKLQQRKLAEGLYDYDDMIRGVDSAINGIPGAGGGAAALVDSLRRRYRYALVDEAQDTEPAQWRIFRRVFLESPAASPTPVVLIGDPKQAIYGFRGADVQTYVQAREEIRARGGVVLPLARNFRSHPEVVDAYNAILDQNAAPPYFSGDDIGYHHPVSAAKPPLGTGPGITLLSADAPADRSVPARIGTIRRALREEIVAEMGRLAARPGGGVPLSEIFVLTRSNSEAREIASRLHAAGIPNVLFKPDNIFGSAEAAQVRALLLAIADPADRAARLTAWLTPFFDVRLQDLATCADPPPEHPLLARLLAWKQLADAHDYDQLWARILDDSGVARRLRLAPAGLRRLTNYRHLFDVLHAAAAARPLSLGDLAGLLAAFAAGRRVAAAGEDDTQRLETEAAAVRVMTIHAAKGLEADYVFIYGGLTA
ncbi:MAG: UvrD-helicase domain-containing protein, partial [Polyangia bacterium]